MDKLSEFDARLTRFLLNELDVIETQETESWINSSEEHRQHFEKLAAAWTLSQMLKTIDGFDRDKEWQRLSGAVGAANNVFQLSESLPETKAFQQKSSSGWIYKTLAAAAIIALICTGWYLYTNHIDEKNNIVPVAVMLPTDIRIFRQDTITNLAPMSRNINLPDGSRIVLHSGSTVSYSNPMPATDRDISLSGKADFFVAKDKKRPFRVSHGELQTIALGTSFTVTASKGSGIQKIRLYEGKVLIRPNELSRSKSKDSFFLNPGQELIYHTSTSTASIRVFRNRHDHEISDGISKTEELSFPDFNKGNWYMFNNQPLAEVLDQMQSLYNVRINYNKSDLRKMYFIGKFDRTDSLDNILERMSILYQLKIQKGRNTYTIGK